MEKDFYARLNALSPGDLLRRIAGKTDGDVERAIAAAKPDIDDFAALVSPAASEFTEAIAQRARTLTRRRFGNVVNFFAPLYLSNLCANNCTYCGFSANNRIARKILSPEEIVRECDALRRQGFESILLVTGEHKGRAGTDYFREILPLVRARFSTVMLEVQPLEEAEYAELKSAGVDAVMVYQETYDAATYDRHHLCGAKKNFRRRLETPERLGRAGIDKIGLGVLLGLSASAPLDACFLAEHLAFLQKRFWRSRFSISFPRLRPCAGGIVPETLVSDAELLRLICAFRLFAPDVEITLSTRESARFRDNVIPICVNNISAGSKTQPGGYVENATDELEQFAPSDTRSFGEVSAAVMRAGLQPVRKDWDAWLGRAG